MVHVGAVIVEPDFTSPGVFVGGHHVEKEDVGFHPLCIKDDGWQPQNGVQFGGFEQLFRTSSPAPPSKSTLSGSTTAS